MDKKKYNIFWRLYNMEKIPKDELTDDEEKKKAFIEYADIRDIILQQMREAYSSDNINATFLDIDDAIQADIDDGLIEEAVIDELYDEYPDLEEYFDSLIYGEVSDRIHRKENR